MRAIPGLRAGVAHPGYLSRIFSIPAPGSKKIPGSASKNLTILTQKMVSKLSEIWSGMFVTDPDLIFLPIPDPRSRSQKGTGSRIRDPDPQHCLLSALYQCLAGVVITFALSLSFKETKFSREKHCTTYLCYSIPMICAVTFLLLHHCVLFSIQKFVFLFRIQITANARTGYRFFVDYGSRSRFLKTSSWTFFFTKEMSGYELRELPWPHPIRTEPPPQQKNILIDYLKVIYIVPYHVHCTYTIFFSMPFSVQKPELAVLDGRRACKSRCWGKLSRSII